MHNAVHSTCALIFWATCASATCLLTVDCTQQGSTPSTHQPLEHDSIAFEPYRSVAGVGRHVPTALATFIALTCCTCLPDNCRCYLGADSETCGGPLCERMVMSMQGTVYRANQAYSHWSSTKTATHALCANVNGPTDENFGNADNPGNAPGRVADQGAAIAPKPLNAPHAMQAGAASAGAQLQYSGHGHSGYYDSDSTNRAVFRGPATIIMGIINGMAGQHKEKWDEGVFEYVPYFLPDAPVPANGNIPAVPAGNPMTTPVSIDASYPWVRDKAYKITFYRGAKY